MKNIYVVTHTESIHHIEELGGGWYDTSLTEKGVAQAEEIARYLYNQIEIKGIPVYSSDLKRASETANIISKEFKTTPIIDKRLREMNFGDGGGKLKDWLDRNINPLLPDGNRLDYQRFKNSESRREVGSRIAEFFNWLENRPDENVIIVTHGLALTFVIMTWLKVPVENMDYCNFVSNSGRITLLNEDGTFRNRNVLYINKTIN